MKPLRRARDAVSGQFRSLAYAALHPTTTVVETVRRIVRKAQR